MKVLVLHSQLGVLRGGGENFSRQLFAAFGQLGHEVRAAFVADRKGRYQFPLPSNVEGIPLPGWWSMNVGQATLSAIGRRLSPLAWIKTKWDYGQNALDWRTFQWHNRRFKRRVVSELRAPLERCDAVYVHSDPFLASEMARIRPTVLRLPGPVGADLLPVLSSVQAVCANGDALACIREFLGERALELPVGLDERLFAPGPSTVRSSLGWSDNELVVGYAGRFTRLKGVDLLAEGFRDVSRLRSDVRLLMMGSGEEEKTIRATLEKEIGRGMVHIEPDVPPEKLASWYRAMDLIVMPSRYENYSNALLEAMACGIPFVAADVGGNRALSESGGSWLCQPNSAASLSSALRTALSDVRELRARGQKAHAYLRGRYSWTATARRLEDILSGLSTRH